MHILIFVKDPTERERILAAIKAEIRMFQDSVSAPGLRGFAALKSWVQDHKVRILVMSQDEWIDNNSELLPPKFKPVIPLKVVIYGGIFKIPQAFHNNLIPLPDLAPNTIRNVLNVG